MKGDLVVGFYGKMIVKKKDRPDDRGSLGHWLVNHMDDVIKTSESTDEIFDRLFIELEIDEVRE